MLWTPSQATQSDSCPYLHLHLQIPPSSSPNPHRSFERSNFVFFEGKRFELEDLLRVSVEMLGKGDFGTAYKAILGNGDVVAVKRLKDAQVGPNERCSSNTWRFWKVTVSECDIEFLMSLKLLGKSSFIILPES